tara:strand:- start:906 stop:1778 length:873 start_codon:yes stop_codon:yes gene_type:complete
MKPNADGYAAALMWAFLMALFLGIQWWSFGESRDPRRVAFDKLSAEEQTEFLQAGEESKHQVEFVQKQLSELQANALLGKKVSPGAMERIMKLNNELIKVKKRSGEFIVPQRPPSHPISAMFYRSCQVVFVISALLPFLILPFIRPKVVYQGLPGKGVFVVTLIPWVWQYRQGVIGFRAITPAVKREFRFYGRGSDTQEADMGFFWMIRLTPQPVSSFELGDHEFRIILKLMPDKGMVGEQLPSYVRDPLRFFEGVTGLQHDRILVEDVIATDRRSAMRKKLDIIHIRSV